MSCCYLRLNYRVRDIVYLVVLRALLSIHTLFCHILLPRLKMSLLRQALMGAAYLSGAAAQYFDGYQTVTDATTPVQIRLAYQGPTAMEGESYSKVHQ